MEHGLKAGIYKIISPVDGSVLTATNEGSPKAVTTTAWDSLDTQKWKVKVRTEDGASIQIIRNQVHKNNELSKHAEDGKDELQPVDWKFTPVGGENPNVFELSNGLGHLTHNGTGERVTFTTEEEHGPNHYWEFEFLSEITKEDK